MSTALAPKLEVPRSAIQQVVMGEPTSLQTVDRSDLIPNSITIPAGGNQTHESVFGTHAREAIAIFKDWFSE
jgi:hypothetical protein